MIIKSNLKDKNTDLGITIVNLHWPWHRHRTQGPSFPECGHWCWACIVSQLHCGQCVSPHVAALPSDSWPIGLSALYRCQQSGQECFLLSAQSCSHGPRNEPSAGSQRSPQVSRSSQCLCRVPTSPAVTGWAATRQNHKFNFLYPTKRLFIFD